MPPIHPGEFLAEILEDTVDRSRRTFCGMLDPGCPPIPQNSERQDGWPAAVGPQNGSDTLGIVPFDPGVAAHARFLLKALGAIASSVPAGSNRQGIVGVAADHGGHAKHLPSSG